MSEHSVTTTASYVLSKYSRSYPSPSPPSVAGGSQALVESEWQHFTNPVMKIMLEAKRSHSGKLLSMRLRILWSLHTDSDDLHLDQRDVVFEDLELLSFSSLPTLHASITQSDQSLPLKAVYRDAVVGIRYLHPKVVSPAIPPTYRRFQITFKDVQDASQCIDVIKPVCPCRANPPPAQITRQSTMISAPLVRAVTAVSYPAPVPTSVLAKHQSIVPVSVDSRPLQSALLGRTRDIQTFPDAPSSAATNLSSDDASFVTCPETPLTSNMQVNPRKDDLSDNHSLDSAQSSLPNSSQPSSSDQSTTTMPPPPVPRRVAHPADAMIQEKPATVDKNDKTSQFLASLSKHPSLYELSRTDLEKLVSQIIREEGFLHLLESLDSLWRLKGCLDH